MYQLDQWRLMHIGAQPVPQSLIKHWKEYFPIISTIPTTVSANPSARRSSSGRGKTSTKVGAIGKAGFGWETKIIDEQGNPVKQGETGELAVRPRRHGLLLQRSQSHCGGAPRRLALYRRYGYGGRGWLHLPGRPQKDVIISGGENIYPVQVEDFLRTNEAIHDVAVIGLPDKRLGEISAAIISLKPGYQCTEEDINAFCHQLPRYKRPRKIFFADVPRNPTGKIEKPKLREMYGAAHLVAEQNQA